LPLLKKWSQLPSFLFDSVVSTWVFIALRGAVSTWVFIALQGAVLLRMHGAHSFSLLFAIPWHRS
jgi:hypothetical protein